jgi:hypothetical protein
MDVGKAHPLFDALCSAEMAERLGMQLRIRYVSHNLGNHLDFSSRAYEFLHAVRRHSQLNRTFLAA